MALRTHLPASIVAAGAAVAAQLVPFTRVRLVFARLTGGVALDTTFDASMDGASIDLSVNVPLSLDLPVLGEPMTVSVSCIDASGTVVYRSVPALVTLRPGRANAPVEIQLEYVGDGGLASIVRITPQRITVSVGQPFAFTATVLDAAGNTMQGVPIVWSVLDAGLATLTSPLGGLGAALGVPGAARVVAQVPDGPADTATLVINPIVLPPVLPPVATVLSFASNIASGVAGAALAPVVVRALDSAGNVVTSFTNEITIALAANPAGAALLGTTTARAINGVATFSNLSLQKATTGYALRASTTGLAPSTSNTFSITHAAASILVIAGGNNQSGLISALLRALLSVRVSDAFDNAVPGVPVAWSVLGGGGLLSSPTTSTDANGIATNGWTLGLLLGVQRAAAAVTGLTGSPATFSATGLLGLTAPLHPAAPVAPSRRARASGASR